MSATAAVPVHQLASGLLQQVLSSIDPAVSSLISVLLPFVSTDVKAEMKREMKREAVTRGRRIKAEQGQDESKVVEWQEEVDEEDTTITYKRARTEVSLLSEDDEDDEVNRRSPTAADQSAIASQLPLRLAAVEVQCGEEQMQPVDHTLDEVKAASAAPSTQTSAASIAKARKQQLQPTTIKTENSYNEQEHCTEEGEDGAAENSDSDREDNNRAMHSNEEARGEQHAEEHATDSKRRLRSRNSRTQPRTAARVREMKGKSWADLDIAVPASDTESMDDEEEKDERAAEVVMMADDDVQSSSQDDRIAVRALRDDVCPDCGQDAMDAEGIYCGGLCQQWVAHREALPFMISLTHTAQQQQQQQISGPAQISDTSVESDDPPSDNSMTQKQSKWSVPQKDACKPTTCSSLTSERPRRAAQRASQHRPSAISLDAL